MPFSVSTPSRTDVRPRRAASSNAGEQERTPEAAPAELREDAEHADVRRAHLGEPLVADHRGRGLTVDGDEPPLGRVVAAVAEVGDPVVPRPVHVTPVPDEGLLEDLVDDALVVLADDGDGRAGGQRRYVLPVDLREVDAHAVEPSDRR